jgi:hypothetical protein
LNAGDLLIPDSVLTQDNTLLATHKLWSQQVITLLHNSITYTESKLLESATVISLAQDKNQQYLQTQAVAVSPANLLRCTLR